MAPTSHTPQRSISLSWLIAQTALKLVPVWPQRMSGIQFSYVQPSELRDPTQFLLADSIVLTVGLAFENSTDLFADYVAKLKAAGVVALGFGTGLSFETVPDELTDACKTHNLALFDVPHNTPFISILNAVNKEFLRQEAHEQSQLIRAQKLLNQAAIEKGLSGLLATTAQLIGAHCVIRDNDDRLIAQAKAPSTSIGAGELTTISHKMLTFGDRYHQLSTSGTKRPTHHDRAVIKHTISLADLLLQRPGKLRKARSDLNTLALSLLLGVDGSNDQLGRIFARISDSKGNVRPILIHSNVATHIDRACAAVDSSLMLADRELCCLRLDSYTALLLFRGTRSVNNVLELFGNTRPKLRICIDSAQHWNHITLDLIHQMTLSVKSLALGTHSSPHTNTARWLNHPNVIEALDHRAAETVGKLDTYDRANDTQLRETLAVFLQQGSSITLTADILGIHRHTVRTRLQKISDICEVDLDDPVTRAELLLVIITRVTAT
ncbi:PucR family transcriptional regulator [Corynebacterium felinum]|uniref:Purine catabolism regulator n=1 Tax=Corynebacterium felinum TaxID=131318 RepID=A0ABU2B4L4_9CORY|nr:PucR family transcriptional regulator [Corynebacterium felinum]MDF5820625.1 PucR family transcriptional regulator [Corynebacterium felinum]MDR7353552.1 purine catabolism regulator [Corynebacterium felinum]WJY95733.1 Purine catabolism regulatory protein-like family protein [Corynebacterium felinum]